MRKLFLLFWALLATTALWAHDFVVDGIYYNYLDDNNVAVTYKGSSSAEYSNEYSGEVTIPETVTYNGTTNSVTSIGKYAFEGCSSLTSITIPNSVTSIGDRAFRYCSSLASVTIPNSVTSIGERAFSGCSFLSSITIPNSVTSIGSDAFFGTYIYNYESNWRDGVLYISNCLIEAQETISGAYTINNNTQVIADRAFSECYSLTSITIPNSVTSIGTEVFYGCSALTSITIPNSVTSIGNYAFYYCRSLTSIIIPESVTSIGTEVFYGCSALTSITIPNSVTSIGNSAFEYCRSLTSIIIPESVTSIGNYAFANCYNLAKVVAPSVFFDIIPEDPFGEFPKNLQYIEVTSGELTDDAWLFINRSYKTLNVLNLSATSNTTLADEALKGCYMLDSLYLPENLVELPYMSVADCKHLKSINIPATVEVIGEGAFENCRLLSEVNFAENGALTNISNWAFYNCHELKNIVIPEGVTNIGYAAFYGCTYLKELTLPASMQSVADNGFALCEKLAKMNVNAVVPPVVEARTFEDVDRTIPVIVPDESVSVYKSAPVWQEFNIVGKNNVPSAVDNVDASNRSTQKLLRDGKLVIIRDGVEYNVMGQEL